MCRVHTSEVSIYVAGNPAADQETLEWLLANEPNWGVLQGLCRNRGASADVIDKAVRVRPRAVEILFHAAANPNCGADTLRWMANTVQYREVLELVAKHPNADEVTQVTAALATGDSHNPSRRLGPRHGHR